MIQLSNIGPPGRMRLACGSKPVMPRHQPRRTRKGRDPIACRQAQPCAAARPNLPARQAYSACRSASSSSRSAIGVSTRNRADTTTGRRRHWQFYIVERREAAAKGLSRGENKLSGVRQEKSVARLCPARHEDRAAVGGQREAENRQIGPWVARQGRGKPGRDGPEGMGTSARSPGAPPTSVQGFARLSSLWPSPQSLSRFATIRGSQGPQSRSACHEVRTAVCLVCRLVLCR